MKIINVKIMNMAKKKIKYNNDNLVIIRVQSCMKKHIFN